MLESAIASMNEVPSKAELTVSIILPVINEVSSLRRTMEILLAGSDADTLEYIIVICERTTPESQRVIRELQELHGKRIVVHTQELPFIGGAVREAFEICRGSHVILMASDLETDPRDVPAMIAAAREDPDSIITATRWVQGTSIRGYNPLKLVLNYVFQRFFALLFDVRLTDMTFGYRLFPSPLVKSIRWEELRHPFLFETIIKPLRLGVRVHEIPSSWRARDEGTSQNTFFRNFLYFRTGIRVRLMPRARILNPTS